MMDRIVVAVAIGMGPVFGTGIMVGIVGMIALAVRREDRRYTLTEAAPDAVARGVRRLAGVGLRGNVLSGSVPLGHVLSGQFPGVNVSPGDVSPGHVPPGHVPPGHGQARR